MRKLLLIAAILPVLLAQRSSRNLMLGMTDAPATPTDSPGAGTYGSTQSVTLSDATAQFILYTTNGSTPACPATGTLYTGAISVATTTTIKAIGCNGTTGGGVLTSVYTISASATFSFVQTWSGGDGTGSNPKTAVSSSSVAAGHMLVCDVKWDHTGAGDSTVTITSSPTPTTAWATATSVQIGAGAEAANSGQTWWTPISASGTTTVSLTLTTGKPASLNCSEYSYTGATASLDTAATTNAAASGNTATVGPVTVSVTGEMLRSACYSVADTCASAGSGFTVRDDGGFWGGGGSLSADKLSSASGSQSSTFTTTGASGQAFIGGLIAFATQ